MERNSTKPYISVVMPVFNREHYVAHALQSLMDQTFQDFEVVVLDDGSTDKTLSICELYAQKDNRIRIFKNKKNMGISYSRNYGNSKAKGEIIVVQDSDDMSLPDRLEYFADTFKTYPHVDIAYSWFYIRAVDIRYGARGIHRELHRCGAYDRKRAVSEPYIPGQLGYRRKIGIKYRPQVKFWDDWAFIIDAAMQNKNFAEIKRPLYEYVISEDSVTTRSDTDGSREIDKETIKRILRDEYKLHVD